MVVKHPPQSSEFLDHKGNATKQALGKPPLPNHA